MSRCPTPPTEARPAAVENGGDRPEAVERRVCRRHSFLKRNPTRTPLEFSRRYEHHHGPLAAGLPGFRAFASSYVQNHVEPLPDGSEPAFDGVTTTTQVPRADYRRGFFHHPDYEKVKADERDLFDVERTVSVLGWDESAQDRPAGGEKAIVLARVGRFEVAALAGVSRLVRSELDRSTASALGFHARAFDHDLLVEAWFEPGARTSAYEIVRALRGLDPAPILLPVREVVIYGPGKPWCTG